MTTFKSVSSPAHVCYYCDENKKMSCSGVSEGICGGIDSKGEITTACYFMINHINTIKHQKSILNRKVWSSEDGKTVYWKDKVE